LKELLRLEDPAQAEPEKISLPGESQPLQRQ